MTKETIVIAMAVPSTGKSGKPFYKINGSIYCFEKEIGRTFEDNIGKTFDVEIDRTTNFHKITQIYGAGTEEINLTPVKPENQNIKVVEKEVIKEKQNSRTIGKGNDQVKIYFDTAEDLGEQIAALEKLNLFPKTE